MDERELTDLESDENWDFERATIHPASKTARAVVPVAFEGDDFKRVSACARQQDKTLSEFIREAVLDRISGGQGEMNPETSETSHPEPLD